MASDQIDMSQGADKRQLAQWLVIARALARRAGEIAMEGYHDGGNRGVEYKNGKDLVTAYDRKVEAFLRKEVAAHFPLHAILGEEEGGQIGDWTWVIDPIDGTENYAGNIPFWCVSLGLLHRGRSVLGVVLDPNRNEEFSAALGIGAFLDGRTLKLRKDDTDAGHRRLAFGLTRRWPPEHTFGPLAALMEKGYRPRLPGAGALALCYVAAGRFQGYFEASIHAWDIAAARVIITEAGGWFHDGMDIGAPQQAFPVCAGAPGLEAGICEATASMFGGHEAP